MTSLARLSLTLLYPSRVSTAACFPSAAAAPAASVADLREALNHPIDHDTERQVRYNLALALNALGDRAAAQDQARLAVSLGSAEALALLPPSR